MRAITGKVRELNKAENKPLIDYGPWFAFFSHDVQDLADYAYVIIPEFDEKLVWGPCRWQERDATSLPTVGDRAIIMFDNRRSPWVIAWWPFDEPD
jgi:hypothetical protein